MLDRWQGAQESMGHVVLVNGEAAIDKSNLVWTIKQHVARDAQAWLIEWRCSPYHQNSALYRIIEMLDTVVLEFGRHESPEEKLVKIKGFLVQYGFAVEEAVPLVASLLSVPLGEGYATADLRPEQEKRKTLEVLLKALLVRAGRQPNRRFTDLSRFYPDGVVDSQTCVAFPTGCVYCDTERAKQPDSISATWGL